MPTFDARAGQPALYLTAVRAQGNERGTAEGTMIVIANNAAADGGIQDEWLKNGLRLVEASGEPSTRCTSQPPEPCAANCSTYDMA